MLGSSLLFLKKRRIETHYTGGESSLIIIYTLYSGDSGVLNKVALQFSEDSPTKHLHFKSPMQQLQYLIWLSVFFFFGHMLFSIPLSWILKLLLPLERNKQTNNKESWDQAQNKEFYFCRICRQRFPFWFLLCLSNTALIYSLKNKSHSLKTPKWQFTLAKGTLFNRHK